MKFKERFCTYCRVFHEKNIALLQYVQETQYVAGYYCKECGSRYFMEG